MKDTTATPLNIVALGMEQKAISTLEMVLRGPGGGWCQLSDAEMADIAILEGDQVGALTLFDQHRRQYPQRPIIVLSVREVRLKQAISLKKPFRIDDLMAALRQAQQSLGQLPSEPSASAAPTATPQPPAASLPSAPKPAPAATAPSTPKPAPAATAPSTPKPVSAATAPSTPKPVPAATAPSMPKPKPVPAATAPSTPSAESHRTHDAAQALETELPRDLCGYAPDVDLDDGEALKTIFYDPAQYLQGSLYNALQAGREQNAAVSIPTMYRDIILVPTRRQCHTPMPERQLRAASVMPLTHPPRWQVLSLPEQHQALQQVSADNPLSTLDAMLWRVTLWTARGRLPTGTDLNAPIRLKYWPNLTRLPLTPQALRIAALWDRKPTSLRDTPKLLAVPQRYVYAFYSACAVLDLVEHSTPATQPPHLDPMPQRGLFKRILNALRRAA